MTGPAQHVFVCDNKRLKPISCGMRQDARGMADRLRERLAECGRPDVQVFTTKCLGRCPQGPVIGILPDNTWYTYSDAQDIDEIAAEHLDSGHPVERLLLRPPGRATA